MAFCRKCGKEIWDSAVFCPHCGSRQDGVQQQVPQRQPYADDSGSIGWAILGFFVPLVGLILWLVWMDDKPKCAKMAGLGALAAVIFLVAIVIIYVALIFALTSTT